MLGVWYKFVNLGAKQRLRCTTCLVHPINARTVTGSPQKGLTPFTENGKAKFRFYLQIYKLGVDQHDCTFALILLIKIFLCSEFS